MNHISIFISWASFQTNLNLIKQVSLLVIVMYTVNALSKAQVTFEIYVKTRGNRLPAPVVSHSTVPGLAPGTVLIKFSKTTGD